MKKRWCVAAVLIAILPLFVIVMMFPFSAAMARMKHDRMDLGVRLTWKEQRAIELADFWYGSWYLAAPLVMGLAFAAAAACLVLAFRRRKTG